MYKIPIFLSPSAQNGNSCSFGDNEQDHCRIIATYLKTFFDKDSRFIAAICDLLSGDENNRLKEAVTRSDFFITSNMGNISGNSSYHICIHTDAGGGSGCSGFYTGLGKGYTSTRKCLDELNSISPWKEHSFYERPGLYEMKTIASTVFLECNFHDNYTQAKWIHDNARNIAYAIYVGICKAENFEALIKDEQQSSDNWKVEAIKKSIEYGLLTDNNWINKKDDSIPVFAACLMLNRLYEGIEKRIDNRIDSRIKETQVKILTKE